MPQRSVATNFTFEQQRTEINLLADDFWSHKTAVDGAASTYLKHDGSNAFTGGSLAVPSTFTINSDSGNGTVTISGNLNVTGTTTTVNTTNLDVTDKNITIAKGNNADATADGAGITIDSDTDITWNFVDANDAWVSSIGVEATTFLKAARGQFTGATSPTTGYGVEINAPDANTGQIIAYNRDSAGYKELRLRASSVPIYTGTNNAIVGTFNSTGLTLESGKTLGVGVAPKSGEGSELAVKGSDGATNIALIPAADTEFSQIAFYNAAYDSQQGYIKYDNNDNSLQFRVNVQERLRIDSNGDLNLGNNPTNQYGYKLNIEDSQILYAQTASSNGTELKLYLDHSNTIANFGTVSTSHLAFVTANEERLRIHSDGKLSVGSVASGYGQWSFINATTDGTDAVGGETGLTIRSDEGFTNTDVTGSDNWTLKLRNNAYAGGGVTGNQGTVSKILFSGVTSNGHNSFVNIGCDTQGTGAGKGDFFVTTGSGSEALRVHADGRVAIGNNPSVDSNTNLHIEEASGECGVVIEGNTGGAGAYLLLRNNSTSSSPRTYVSGIDASGQGIAQIDFWNLNDTNNEGAISLSTRPSGGSMTQRLYIGSNGDTTFTGTGGNVFTITSDSYNVLDLVADSNNDESNSDNIIRFRHGSGGSLSERAEIRYDESDSRLELSAGDNQNHLVIKSDGFVGVGVNPTAKFHVSSAYNETPVKIAGGAHNGYSSPLQVMASNGDMRLEVSADNGVQFTRGPVGGAEHVSNTPDMWQKIGIWKGAFVDGAARCKITVMGTDTHDAGGNVAGETIIYLAFGANHALKGYFYSTSGQYPGLAGVAWNYDNNDSSNKKVEIWVKYDSAYGMTQCYADCSTGLFEGANINTGLTTVPAGATELESYFNVRTATGGTNYERLRITADGRTGICTPDARFGQGNSASSNQMYQNTPKLGVEGSIVIGNLSSTDTDVRELAFYRRAGSTAGSPISTHKMGRIAWYGSSNDSSFPDKAWSLECTPNGAGWTAGSNRRGYLSFVNHDGEHIRIKSNGGLFVENTLNSDAQLNVFKASGDDANHARLRVGYDESNCWEVSRKRNSGNIVVDANQSGAYVYHRTEGKDAAIITPTQVFATAKHATKVAVYSGINTAHWGDEAVRKFYGSYYAGPSAATYHVARMISQEDWGFDNIEFKVAKYQYNPTSDDLASKQFTTYYGGHSSRWNNYNQQSSGSGTGAWNVIDWRQDFGPGGAHQIHNKDNGGYYRHCYGSDVYVTCGTYTGIRLEITVWATCGLYDCGNYATAYDFYPANFGSQASQTDADNWGGPRGTWFNTAPNGTGQGTNYGLFNISTGVVYGESQM